MTIDKDARTCMALMLRLWQPCPVTVLAIEIVEENPTGGKTREGEWCCSHLPLIIVSPCLRGQSHCSWGLSSVEGKGDRAGFLYKLQITQQTSKKISEEIS